MELFKIALHTPVDGTDNLYFRCSGGFNQATGALNRGAVLTLDTYFNSFSCRLYAEYTMVTKAAAELDVEGALTCRLLFRRSTGPDQVLCELRDENLQRRLLQIPFDLLDADGDGFYYLCLIAESEGCVIHGGRYLTDGVGVPVRLAVVICSYRREQYVTKNVTSLRAALLDNAEGTVSNDMEIFVVDNGNTLAGLLPMDDSRVSLFPNKNCGGSGGFTRGMIEVMKRRESFTHVLLMDDDILIDPNVVEKTIQLLKLRRPEYADLHIAGGMLRLDEPVFQEEATARWAGDLYSLNAGLNLTDPAALLENEKPKRADYGAWWYMCMPLDFIQADNLPLPLFIKADDVEYGMRNMKQVLVMNGLAVWHENFAGKESPYMDYYIIRNYLVVGSIHDIPRPAVSLLAVIFKRMMRTVAFDIPQAAVFAELAVRDYLEGVDFFLRTDSEALNTYLRSIHAPPVDVKGVTKAQKRLKVFQRVFSVAFWCTLGRFCKVAVLYLGGRKRADADFKAKWREIASQSFWNRLMEL